MLAFLKTLFANAVDRPDFDVHDSFFAVGGDSLAAAEVLSRIDDELGVELVYKDFLEAPTPARLALTILVERSRQRGTELASEIEALSPEDATILVEELERE